uniref:Uncharacterized protein n=1 Tax=Oryza barthii TaxID=65489 RepID=A0A0D3FA88_9ORYZ
MVILQQFYMKNAIVFIEIEDKKSKKLITASPLARTRSALLRSPDLLALAATYGLTPALLTFGHLSCWASLGP